ncbi:MAG: hypothetical protein ACYTFO_10425, partial [Planctomycetota bacterium]
LFLIKGIAKRLHRRRLAIACRSLGMEFSGEDPFAVVQLFADFALLSIGHGARARNVAHGRLGSWRVRCFEVLYEVGHGVRRHARLYAAAVAEVPAGWDRVVLWHREDIDHAPLQVFRAEQGVGAWVSVGDPTTARQLAAAAHDVTDVPMGMEITREWLMVFAPIDGHGMSYPKLIEALPIICDRLEHARSGDQAALASQSGE